MEFKIYSQNKHLRQAPGFSLVEILFTLGLLAIILTVILSSTITSSKILHTVIGHGDISQRLRYTQETLARDVRSASSVSVSSASAISLTMPNSDVIDYSVDSSDASNTKLVRDDENGDEHVILEKIGSLTFSSPTSSEADLQMNVTITIPVSSGVDAQRTIESHFTSRAAGI